MQNAISSHSCKARAGHRQVAPAGNGEMNLRFEQRQIKGGNTYTGKVIMMLINSKELRHKFFPTSKQVFLVAEKVEETDQVAKVLLHNTKG